MNFPRRAWLWSILGLFALALGARAGDLASIEFLDVGQGDSVLIRSPEGKTALVDAGPSATRIVALLKERGIEQLDLAVVSHPHIDHFGGMTEVVRKFHPRVFLDSGWPNKSPEYLKLLEELRKDETQVIRTGTAPRTLRLGSVSIVTLPQPPRDRKEENNNSVGLRVSFGSFTALLTGDSEEHERDWWMQYADPLCSNVSVLKLAHHGSRNGTSTTWLNYVRPALAVISLGSPNDYGHPHEETIRLLERMDIPLRRTDRSGSISIETDGRLWRITASKGTKADPRASPAGTIDLNRATEAELKTLPGIGSTYAKRIIEARPYRSVDDLLRVKNLGARRVDKIRPFVGVE